MASAPVVEAAEQALKFVVDLSMGPGLSEAEVRAMMDDAKADAIGAFAKVCREGLNARG